MRGGVAVSDGELSLQIAETKRAAPRVATAQQLIKRAHSLKPQPQPQPQQRCCFSVTEYPVFIGCKAEHAPGLGGQVGVGERLEDDDEENVESERHDVDARHEAARRLARREVRVGVRVTH